MINSKAALHIFVFNGLWAVAHSAHVLRKEGRFDPLAWIVLLSSVLLIERPSSRVRLGLLVLSQTCLFVSRLPFIDNHMYIMFFINAGILVSVVSMVISKHTWQDGHAHAIKSYTVVALIISYASAAIAKLNHGFFDPRQSCAVKMLYDASAFVGIQEGRLPGIIEGTAPFIVAGIELLIPVLLVVSRTRFAGIVVLVVFHLAISISPSSTAIDFTIMLFAIAYLLLREESSEHVILRFRQIRSSVPRMLRPDMRSIPVVFLFFLSMAFLSRLGTVAGNRAWALLAPVSLVIGALLVFLVARSRSSQPRGSISLSGIKPHYALIGLLLFNVASPYMGIKTVGTFTMYSNLNTYDSQSNHFFLPRLSLSTLHDDLVDIVRSSNEELDALRRKGLRITWHELRRELARDPKASIAYIRGGKLFEYERADQNPGLATLHPVLHKLVWHRPDDRHSPQCLW